MQIKKSYNRLRIVLAEKNKSNRELAKALNCSETTVSRWCTNDTQPYIETLFKIALYLKVEAKELISNNSDI